MLGSRVFSRGLSTLIPPKVSPPRPDLTDASMKVFNASADRLSFRESHQLFPARSCIS